MQKKHLVILSLAVAFATSLLVWAAPYFVPNSQPYGYVAPPVFNGTDVGTGSAVAYTPWFENGAFQGDIIAYPVSSDGVVDLLNPNWNAKAQIANQNFNTGRNIITFNSGGIPFRWGSLSDSQKTDLDPATPLTDTSSTVLNFIRGDQSNEISNGGSFHNRSAVLGDIIHSQPVYVGAPSFPYTFNSYLTFANGSAKTRAHRLYVGANDGMLHALDVATGQEMFGYIPSIVVENLPLLKVNPYAHQYFVDGTITMGDVYYDSAWHTVLVGGLGAGGRGFYALDVTSATTLSDNETTVAAKVLWEYDTDSSNGGDLLGFSYGRPSIVRLNSGGSDKKWATILANGYMSDGGGASLHIRNIQDGTEIKTFSVGTASTSSPNGLSSPVVIDVDGNGTADFVYAGDIDGNLWKFDISSSVESNWSASLFYTATDSGGAPLSIIAAPEVASHPGFGRLVYIATGRLFTETDAASTQIQSVFGLIDNGSALTGSINLLAQTLTDLTHPSGKVKVITNYSLSSESGWRVNFPAGERVIQDMIVRDNRLQFITVDSTSSTGENWLYELNYLTGGSPGNTILDINDDNSLNASDNIDGNSDGDATDPEDVVVAQQQSFGLASRPIIIAKGSSNDIAIINHLQAISPTNIPPPVVSGSDLGLLGGHFDLDTTGAGKTFAYEDGATDKHEHQWDDKNNRTTVDYFNIVKCADPLDQSTCTNDTSFQDISDEINTTQQFHIIISNAELSTGAVMEINGASISAVDYQTTVEAAIAGSGSLPVYTLGGAAGSTQLSTLKMSFDASAILDGGLVPTETGCVKGNDPGKFNEYRNGALTIQAVAVASFPAQVNELVGPSSETIRGGKGTGLVKHIDNGNSALLWESTLFWHWSGGCYGSPTWDTKYLDCIINGNIQNCTKDGSATSCTPGKRYWEFEFSRDIDASEWTTLGDMTLTVILSTGATTSITFNDTNFTDQDTSTNVTTGISTVTIDLSSASMDKKKLKNVAISNTSLTAVTIIAVKVNWTGSSNLEVKKVKDPTKDYKIDPLSENHTTFAKNTNIPIGGFLLESIIANSCNVNTGFDGSGGSSAGPVACNMEQLLFEFDKNLTDAGSTASTTSALEIEFAHDPTGTYYITIDFNVAGDDKQVVLNQIIGTTIDSISGDTNFLDVDPAVTVAGKKMTASVSNVSSASLTITDITVSWTGAPGGQKNKKVKSNGITVYDNPDLNSGVIGTFNPSVLLATNSSGTGPNYEVNFSVSAGIASINNIAASESPVFESANVDGSVSAISTLGLDGGLISIITTSGKKLSIRLTNSDDSDVDVTITSVGWINAHNDQKFKKVKNDAGSTLYDPDSAKASALTYPINVSFTLTGQSCLAPESSSSEGGDGGGDGSGEGDGDGSGSSGSEGDGDDSSSDSDESASTDTPIDPEAGVSSTNQSGGSSIEGRLSWREIVF